jgi:prepilin-type processing-associated H-X9-DG protein
MRRSSVIVLAVLAVVVGGLLVAYLPRLHEAAARQQCVNNLRLLTLALHNYAGSYDGWLPAGTMPNKALPPERRLSWLVAIMPFIDQIGLVIDRTRGWDDETNRVPAGRYLDTDERWVEEPLGQVRAMSCPANTTTAGPGAPGLTHYVGVAGLGVDAPTRPLDYPGNGIFGHDRRTNLGRIADGAAHTLMLIETTWDNGPWTAGGFPTVRGLDPAAGPYLGPGGQFASNHGVTNVAFADGSVRGLGESVSREVLEAWTTVAGGERVGEE